MEKIFSQSRNFFSIFIPFFIALLSQSFVFVLSTYYIAKVSPFDLAANSFCQPIILMFNLFVLGTGLGYMVLASRSYGNKNKILTARLTHAMFLYQMALSLFSGICIILLSFLVHSFGQHIKVSDYASSFLFISGLGFIITPLSFYIHQLFLVFKKQRYLYILLPIYLLINFCLFNVFILGGLGMPVLGLVGMAYSQIIASLLLLILVFLIIYSDKELNYLLNKKYFKLSTSIFWDLTKIGIPTSISLIFEYMLFIFMAIVIGWFGYRPQAAFNVAMQFNSIGVIISVCASQSLTVIISQALGAKKYHNINLNFSLTIVISFFFLITYIMIYVFYPNIFHEFFLSSNQANDTIIRRHTHKMLDIFILIILITNIRFLLLSVLRSFKDVVYPMFATGILAIFLCVPIILLFAYTFDAKSQGVVWGLIVFLIVLCATFAHRVWGHLNTIKTL